MSKRIQKDPKVQELADRVAEKLDADVVHFNGPIWRPTDQHLISACSARCRRKNVLLMLVTTGGDPNAAYRIARCLQTKYGRFFLYVSGFCKSAGTLVALGAHELIMSDHGELGPLDVQMSKKDEIWETQSGLAVRDSMTALQDGALQAFEECFLHTKGKIGGTITLKTAYQIATKMTAGLFVPLYSQIDPLYIAEAFRAMSIAGLYGARLLSIGQNIDKSKLPRLISDYPSHGYVIDRNEASELFENVRGPERHEMRLEEMLGDRARWPDNVGSSRQQVFAFLSTELPMAKNDNSHEHQEGDKHATIGDAAGARRGDANEEACEQPKEFSERATVAKLDATQGTRRYRRRAKT